MTQPNGGLTLSAEQVKELRTYLGKQPYDVVQPVLVFLAQLEAEQARKAQEELPKQEQETENKVTGETLKPKRK